MTPKTRPSLALSLCRATLFCGALTAVQILPTALSSVLADPAVAATPPANKAPDAKNFKADKAIFKSVDQHIKQKQYDRAASLADGISDPLMKELAQWLIHSSDVGLGSYETLNGYIAEPDNWPRQEVLRRTAEAKLPDNLSTKEIITWFRENPPSSLGGINSYASALEKSGKKTESILAIRTFWQEGYLGKTDETAFLKTHKAVLKKEDHDKRLDGLIWNRQYSAADRQLARVSKDMKALGEARLGLLKKEGNVDGLINKVPKALKKDPGLVYARARWRLNADRNDEVIELLDPPIANVPEPEKWWSLRHWAARKLLISKEYEKSYRIAAGHGMTSGEGFAEGEWLAGWIALRKLDMPKRAYTHFHTLYEGVGSPISKARAAYWAGRAAKDIGQDDWAKSWFGISAKFPTTFYGQQAGYMLGQSPDVSLFQSPDITASRRSSFENKKIVRIIRLLDKMDETDLEVIFLTRLRLDAQTAEDYTLAANLAIDTGHPNLALRAAKSARQKDILLPDILFPEVAVKANTKQDPEKALVLAVIRQESEFKQNAISHAGARGLMQLMPATAQGVAKKEKLKYTKQRLTDDPAYNVRLGSAYLSELLGSFDGSYVMALAGYNAGPYRVRQWVKEYGDPRDPDVDVIDWMEQIPFNETRNYVQRILESHLIYRNKLNTGTPATKVVATELPFTLWGHQPKG
ncbi:lytic transglycosylase domain-containing protein [Kiloniella laminariae]|uniref:lytic transglycosylase domain-containing protein n=1 Tax=Kiloniella laminariae TaxID=454162 RepID=UPI0003816DC5|nr:lytic transglycosylase domain-containing protein [Kiloniella laminariae]